MSRSTITITVLMLLTLLTGACVPIQAPPATANDSALDAKIAEAMSAAGPAISAEATILDWPAEPGDEMIVVREGTNRWTCFPAMPYYPDGVGRPMCVDEVWLAFMTARMAGEEFPAVTEPGIAYMLDGGGGPSISDPFAMEPAPGSDWIKDAPPHVMILTPGDLSAYTQVPGNEPWAMFPDTSFAHIMVNIHMPEATEADAAQDPKIAEAMSAAGPAISAEATILDWPAEPGDEMIVVREGTNRWTCFPAMPYYPDGVGRPMCVDEVWLAFMTARMAGEEFPAVTEPGIAYMLDGGGGPSISDPFAMEPAPGSDWIKDAPPHIMILTPGDLSAYTQVPGNEPWAMFPDTSFAHLMVNIHMPAQ